MSVGLFIARYIDAFFPEVGIATLELLERLTTSRQFRKPTLYRAW